MNTGGNGNGSGSPLFQRQQRSKAVAIVDPLSNEAKSVPAGNAGISKAPPAEERTVPTKSAATKTAKAFKKKQREQENAPKYPIVFGARGLVSASDPADNVEDEREFEDEEVDRAFNVYATPFVPEAFTLINTLPGLVLETVPTKQINYQSHAHLRANPNLVLQLDYPPSPLPAPAPKSTFSSAAALTPIFYGQFFRFHLEEEIISQQRENATYALYGHPVMVPLPGRPDGPSDTACWLQVPGLRENAPFIEEGDVVELRQLNYGPDGKLYGMDYFMTQIRSPFGMYSPQPVPGWTGVIYHARVDVVKRKDETLRLRAYGLGHNNILSGVRVQGEHQLKFNIQFPVPKERYLPMNQVLAGVQRALIQNVVNLTTTIQTGHSWFQAMLFPNEVHCEMQTKLHPGTFKQKFFDEELNWEQKKAVEAICLQNYGTLPYLISGPPGTGKTKTVIEAALQLVCNVDGVDHVLLCAPSETAADTLAIRLRNHFQPSRLLRLNRATRTFAEVPGSILSYCHVVDNIFALPPMPQLLAYQIVVTSCRDAAILVDANMTNADLYAIERSLSNLFHPSDGDMVPLRLHWTALLMDEAAQAIEPEALLPMAVVAPPPAPASIQITPRFAMVGDQHQLTPRTSLSSSPLKTSLFARLFARDVYTKHPLARSNDGKPPPALNQSMLPILRPAFANLIRNYRSHPAILAIPSALFYHDTLEPYATDTDVLLSWPHWRGRGWPVIFHNNTSRDELERDGGGWYNLGEVRVAVSYAHLLVQSGLIPQREICIMSPFKAQVMLIRQALRQHDPPMWDVNVGPTEVFQGQEYSMVIICTTRSKEKFRRKDVERGWGMVCMPHIMNVALTRAKHGLIVVGKRNILAQDPNWQHFMSFCSRNGLVAPKEGLDWTNGAGGPRTRLEKGLVMKESVGMAASRERALGFSAGDDEDDMWRNGVRDDGVIETYPDEEEYEDEYDDREVG